MDNTVLVLNRHPYDWLFDGERCLFPMDIARPLLVTNFYGVTGHQPALFPETMICDFLDDGQIDAVVEWLHHEHKLSRVIALHEKSLLHAAALRSRLGIPGMPYETALLFRDKVAMKTAVRQARVRVPQFKPVDSAADLVAPAWPEGARKVLKSRYGVGGDEAYIVDSLAQANAAWQRVSPAPGRYEIEEYIDGVMYHCDAVVSDGRVHFASVCEYFAKPGDFGPGRVGSSVLLPSGPLRDRIIELNAVVLNTLGMCDGVTHLEVFHTPADELVFCEVAARPGGGGIDRINVLAYGVHLVEAALRLEAGGELIDLPRPPSPDTIYGTIGFYPDPGNPGGIESHRFAELGIAEHEHYDYAGIVDGNPRHCTDYVDRYVLAAPDRPEFRRRFEAIRQEYIRH
ncbi:MAG TPA: hypothetical protein VFC19_11695 [Candidatus Limnocylindrales bacterium]|nr:hypothetical protein [Candidatus Limnocylindrales bacterium]